MVKRISSSLTLMCYRLLSIRNSKVMEEDRDPEVFIARLGEAARVLIQRGRS
jgi:hypothetical protein